MQETVCVIIAAKDAAATIGAAVRSALDQAQVTRVVVVDDASTDATAQSATEAAEGDARLSILRCVVNRGPAAARNLAIAESEEALIAILDADDSFLPGRFDRLLSITDWDMVADNVAFVHHTNVEVDRPGGGSSFRLTATEFVRGNISRPGLARGEFGFLKPVVRRSFLESHDLAYDESIRLGEDYDLYLRMLLAGARFAVVGDCGYRALVRANSLSGQHSTTDLQRLAEVDHRALRRDDLDAGLRSALRDHLSQANAKFHHRRFLDERRARGLGAALGQMGSSLEVWQSVVGGILRDKLAGLRPRRPGAIPSVRYLLDRQG